MRIATYVRVSTAQQDDGEKTSLTEQSSACDAYATSHGWEIVNRYSDVGSGADSTRPGFLQLLDATRNGEIDGVLTWKPDRLYRALGPAADLADALESDKAEFHSVQDAVDAKSLPLYAAVAALERSGIKERMALGKLGAAKAGKVPTGLLSMGYRRGEDGRPVIHQAEAEIVKRIYQWSIERLGAKEIAARLNDDGVRNRNGSRWYTSLIWRILEKPTYKGDWQYDGVEVSFPPIISADTWEKAQEARRRHKSLNPGSTKRSYMLQHLVRCAECGRIFSAWAKWGGGKRYYICQGIRNYKTDCRRPKYVGADVLEELACSPTR